MKYRRYNYQWMGKTKATRKALLTLLAFVVLPIFGNLYSRIKDARATDLISPLSAEGYMELVKTANIDILTLEVEGKIKASGKEDIARYTEEIFGKDAPLMKRVAYCESGMRENAVGPTKDYGVFQIHQPSHGIPVKFLKNYKINILIAKQLFDESGTAPWKASRKCWGG